MAKIIVEGWRFLPHSFATVNQFQCLELLKRQNIELYHRDVPYWNGKWRPVPGLFDASKETALREIPPPPSSENGDVTLRCGCPFDFSRASSRRTVTFATCEFGRLTPDVIATKDTGAYLVDPGVTVITPSRWSKDGLVRSGIDPHSIDIVPHGIDPAIFHPPGKDERNALRRKFGWENSFIFLHISAMTPNKGVPNILKSLYDITEKAPHARLVLKGLDSLYASTSALNECLEKLPLHIHPAIHSRIAYTSGDSSYRDIANLYKAADAYVAPYIGEGFNLPVLEATACGLPVICTAGGATDDFTTSDFRLAINSTRIITGDANNPQAIYLSPDQKHLTSLMQQVIEDSSWRNKARLIGPEYVREHFTWKRSVDKLESILLD